MVGKKIRGDLYIYRDALERIDTRYRSRLEIALAHAGQFKWNVARIGSRDVSLLRYEDFDLAAFPTLLETLNIKLEGGESRQTNYEKRTSRPILHRKELLLAPDDPRFPKFAALTRSAEEKGLFQDPKRIGSSKVWQ